MKRVTFLLRVWVIVGAALLLLQTPRGGRGYAEYSPGSCINYATPTQTCPSGCTNSSFTQTTMASGNGIYYLVVKSTTPCGSAKTGKTCNNPTQYGPYWDFQDCCAALGAGCTGVGYSYMNCCTASAVCMSGTCCIPDTHYGCSNDSDCCSGGPCWPDGECGGSNCGQEGDVCNDQYPCCIGLTCPGGTCTSSGGGGGSGGGGSGGCNDNGCPDPLCCNTETGNCESCKVENPGVSHPLGRVASSNLHRGRSADAPLGGMPSKNKPPMVREPGKRTASTATSSVGDRERPAGPALAID
jgi:hypothetical protein